MVRLREAVCLVSRLIKGGGLLVAVAAVAAPKHDIPEGLGLEAVAAPAVAQRIVELDRLQLTPDSTYVIGERPQLTDLAVMEQRLWVGSFHRRLYQVEIKDPTRMRLSATLETQESPVDIKSADGILYVGLQTPDLRAGGLLVVKPGADSLEVLGRVPLGGNGGAHNLALAGTRAYVAHSALHAEGRGISIIDISEPKKPVVVGRWVGRDARFSNVIHDLYIDGTTAYLCDIIAGQGGLVIVDLSDPDRPQPLGALPVPEGLHSAWKVGDYLYCNQEFGGREQNLYVVDVADPAKPRLVHTFAADGPPDGPVLGPHNPIARDGLLYWAYYDAGFRVFDLAEPGRPRQMAYHTGPFAWSAQPHADGVIYATDSGRGGVGSFKLEEEGNVEQPTVVEGAVVPLFFTLAQNRPNPFNSTTVIEFEIDAPAAIALEVFNSAGQQVAVLLRGHRAAGRHQVRWDGRDLGGRPAASGLYSYRLSVGLEAQSRSMVLLK